MTGAMIETLEVVSPHDIAAVYADKEAPIPRLSGEALQGVFTFLRDNDCYMIGGTVLLEDDLPIGQTLKMSRSNLFDMRNDTFAGPYIDDSDDYYPKGVGIWVSRKLGDIR